MTQDPKYPRVCIGVEFELTERRKRYQCSVDRHYSGEWWVVGMRHRGEPAVEAMLNSGKIDLILGDIDRDIDRLSKASKPPVEAST